MLCDVGAEGVGAAAEDGVERGVGGHHEDDDAGLLIDLGGVVCNLGAGFAQEGASVGGAVPHHQVEAGACEVQCHWLAHDA